MHEKEPYYTVQKTSLTIHTGEKNTESIVWASQPAKSESGIFKNTYL